MQFTGRGIRYETTEAKLKPGLLTALVYDKRLKVLENGGGILIGTTGRLIDCAGKTVTWLIAPIPEFVILDKPIMYI